MPSRTEARKGETMRWAGTRPGQARQGKAGQDQDSFGAPLARARRKSTTRTEFSLFARAGRQIRYQAIAMFTRRGITVRYHRYVGRKKKRYIHLTRRPSHIISNCHQLVTAAMSLRAKDCVRKVLTHAHATDRRAFVIRRDTRPLRLVAREISRTVGKESGTRRKGIYPRFG